MSLILRAGATSPFFLTKYIIEIYVMPYCYGNYFLNIVQGKLKKKDESNERTFLSEISRSSNAVNMKDFN